MNRKLITVKDMLVMMEKSIYTMNYDLFRCLLRTVREEQKLTQTEVAIRLEETQTFVSKVERGERRLDVIELQAWCAALGVTLEEFIRRLEAKCQLR